MSKMVKCKTCGADIAKSAMRCPKCGARQHNITMTAVYLIIIVTVIAIIAVIAGSLGGNSATNQSAVSAAANVSKPISSVPQSTGEKEIYSDKILSVTFISKQDMPGFNGNYLFTIKVENKSSEKITVAPTEEYVNDTMVQWLSSVPLTILPGKSGNGGFFGKYEGTGASKANEIKKIGFKFFVMDDSSTLETTKNIEVTF